MDTLHSLISSLNKEEIRFFKLYTQRYATGAGGLGSRLLDLMRKEDEPDEDEIFKKLYKKPEDKNTYYRLKNRLQEDICDTLSLLHFGKNESNNLHRTICIHNILLEKGKHELAYYFMKKAEKRARQTDNYELLDLIYANLVKLSNDVIDINPEEYIAKQSENALMLNRVRQMDQVLAALNYRIKLTQNFQKGNESLLKLVDKTAKDFSKDKSISENRNFQIKIYRAISQAMVQKKKYKELEPFLLKTYSNFESKKWFDKDTHDVHLQMLVYIGNTLYTNKKFKESLEYTKQLGLEMVKYDKLLYEKYLFFYYNSLALNYSKTNGNMAFATLDEFEQINKKNKNSFYDQFIHLNRAIFYFDADKYSEAVRSIIKLYVNDYYRQTDRSFKLDIEIAEVIMQYETGDKSTVEKRIKQIRKSYKDLLIDERLKHDNSLLNILYILAQNDKEGPENKINTMIKNLIKEMQKEQESATHVINHLTWLETLKKHRN